MIYQACIESPVGPLQISTTFTHLMGIRFLSQSQATCALPPDTPPILKEVVRQLQAYFNGKLFAFHLPLQLSGTPFQQKVWMALQTIPYGTVLSYQELAQKIGHPRAMRAVGNANGKNPIPIIIPCHRVIRSDGSLGGYSSGTAIKSHLLQLEQHFRYRLK